MPAIAIRYLTRRQLAIVSPWWTSTQSKIKNLTLMKRIKKVYYITLDLRSSVWTHVLVLGSL